MKFPSRRAIGLNEFMAVNKLFYHALISGVDPGYEGSVQQKFKKNFLSWFNDSRGYLSLVNSGTNAIFLALKSKNLVKGDVIHTSSITDPGSISAIIEAGFKVNILDSESVNCGNSCVNSLKDKLSSNSAGVLLVHHAGWSADTCAFKVVCDEYNIPLIEDFSQAIGATCNNMHVGTIGHISASSTMYRKALCTGGCGGIIYSKTMPEYRIIELLKDRGKPVWQDNFYSKFSSNRDGNNVAFPSLNYNQNDINMAIGISSLNRLSSTINLRQQLAGHLYSLLSNFIIPPIEYGKPSPFIIPLTFPDIQSKETVSNRFQQIGVPHNPDYRYNVSDWNWTKPYLVGNCDTPNTSDYLRRTLFLYINERYKSKHIKFIAEALIRSLE